jgi:ribosomal protein S27E
LWRTYTLNVIYRYLDCGDLHNGFARVKCKDCGHEYLLAFSCKRRHFCPSCHQKRVIEFGEWLCTEVLKSVSHRQWVFSIPKRLRIYFMYDRKLLSKLSRCGWKVLSTYLKRTIPDEGATPGAAIAVQTFGDFQNFNPHLHVIAADGCFSGNSIFQVGLSPKPKDLQDLFRYEVFKMLKAEGKITDAVIENMLSWRHSGFNVYCGPAIWPHDEDALENLAHYIIRAAFSQERMTYIAEHESSDGIAKVTYQSKDGKTSKTFDGLDWLAQLTTHIPDKNEQMVRYYGYYSNKSRGMRKGADKEDDMPALINSDLSAAQFRRNWARLIQKVYEVDPLICPKCQGEMRVISIIEDQAIIKKILQHLGIWETRSHDPPACKIPHTVEFTYDDAYSQIPPGDYFLQ